jgi:hypothetical protein
MPRKTLSRPRPAFAASASSASGSGRRGSSGVMRLRVNLWEGGVEGEIGHQHVDVRLADEAEERRLDVVGDQRLHDVGRGAARLGDAVGLQVA